MSRCFPYPPPGYSLSRSSKEALIESIKLQKEKEKAKDKEQRKKEKKRDKKEKNKEKKERKKEEKNKVHQKLDKSDIVQGQIGEKIWADIKGVSLHRGSEAESEQRSSLTEEHRPPTRLHVPSSSSDSTENSNKRKRQSSPVDVSRGHGKIIRIRLSKKQNNSDASVNEQQPCSTSGRTLSKKQNDSDASVNEQQICSTSGRTYFPSQGKDDVGLLHRGEHFCSTSEETSKIGRGLTSGTDRKQICSTSRQFETLSNSKTEIPPITDAVVTPLQRAELQYKNLIENWVPPQLLDASLDPEDLDWLFQGKNQAMHTKRRQISGKDSVISSSSLTLWPHAQYLPEVDLYALPFTVPF